MISTNLLLSNYSYLLEAMTAGARDRVLIFAKAGGLHPYSSKVSRYNINCETTVASDIQCSVT